MRGFVIFLAIVVLVVAFGGIRYYQFSTMRYTGNSVLNDGEALTQDAATQALESFEAAESGLENYTISINPETYYWKYAVFQAKPATVMKTTKDGVVTYFFDLNDYDCGTGLEPFDYYIMQVDGKLAVIRECMADEIYPEGSKKFDEAYPKLMALTYEGLIDTDVYRKSGESLERQKAKQMDGKIIFDYAEKKESSYVRRKLLTEESRATFLYAVDSQKSVFCFFSYGNAKIDKLNTDDMKVVTD